MSLSINNLSYSSLHFTGILGIGMSAIAQFLASDMTITGSDRGCGSEAVAFPEQALCSLGCAIFPQDGSGISPTCHGVVISTAIEESNPDLKRARELNIPILHRSEVLAAIVNSYKTISVTGTSGKSTVSAMIFHVLRECKIDASYIGGANLHALRDLGMIGNGFRGSSDVLVIEADESDGTVVRYHPEISVLLNISRDHKEEAEVEAMLSTSASQSRHVVKNGEDVRLKKIAGSTFGFDMTNDLFPDYFASSASGVSGAIRGLPFSVQFPGNHTVANVLATVSAVQKCGITIAQALEALRSYRGIERRFDRYPVSPTITVIDDYAHNPEKIAAAIKAAQELSADVTAIFQPHGFGPLKFMYDDLKSMFLKTIRPNDRLILLPVYYAGGTVDTSVDSQKLCQEIPGSISVERSDLPQYLRTCRRDPDTIILLGARDPSLPLLARDIQLILKGTDA